MNSDVIGIEVETKRKISLIIPIRLTEQVYQGEERLTRILKLVPRDLYDIIIVDEGTPDQYRDHLIACATDGVTLLLRPELKDSLFSIGRARNHGVQHATNDVTIFHDVDYLANTTMYRRIYDEVCSRDLWSNAYDFFCIPALFLSHHGTDEYMRDFADTTLFNMLIQRKFSEGKLGLESCAYGSSAIVINKWHYLAMGGSNTSFRGHGAEDYDLLHRLSAYCKRGPKTADYFVNTKNNAISSYRGFRAFFAIYGIDTLQRGVFLVHLWHESRTHIENYYQSKANYPLLEKCMRDFDKNREQPAPLANLANPSESCLVLVGNMNGTSNRALYQALTRYGRYEMMEEGWFTSGEELREFVNRKGFTCVGFINPYGNEHRLNLYRHLRHHGDPFWVFDRGALPRSWFFDRGFNFDSPSYSPSEWDFPLTVDEYAAIHQYMSDLRNGNETLEENGDRQSPEQLRMRYCLGSRKVLFIPLQRPGDTVTNYFAGPVGGMETFYEWIAYVAANLDRKEWGIIIKKHPLESNIPEIENVTFVAPETHVHDLLEVADCVYLMNSGVGVLAQAFGKPVVCAAQAFYGHDGLAVSVASPAESVVAIKRAIPPDPEKTHRFYHHLVNRVYSFGGSTYKKFTYANGSSRTIVQELLFERLNLQGREYRMGKPIPMGATLDSPLFASFGGRASIKQLIEQSKTKPAAKLAAIPAARSTESSASAPLAQKKNGMIANMFQVCEKGMFRCICNKDRYMRYTENRELFLRGSRFKILQLYYKLFG